MPSPTPVPVPPIPTSPPNRPTSTAPTSTWPPCRPRPPAWPTASARRPSPTSTTPPSSTRCGATGPPSTSAAPSASAASTTTPATAGTSAAATSRTSSGDAVVVDWRAGVATPFYRATFADPLGLARAPPLRHRRAAPLIELFDEDFADPDSAHHASGIPDPLLAELDRSRTGQMRDIVATIQAEQDLVIRAPLDVLLVVQGGPGTGKTAVGLHRAALLLYDHREPLERDGVLVVGPNRLFLRYIAQVLPSLGETSVVQTTVIGPVATRRARPRQRRRRRAQGRPAAGRRDRQRAAWGRTVPLTEDVRGPHRLREPHPRPPPRSTRRSTRRRACAARWRRAATTSGPS